MRRRGILGVVGACLLLFACKASVTIGGTSGTTVKKPRIDRVVLATDYKDGQAVGQTTVFSPTFAPDSSFHAVIDVGGPDSATKVKVSWIAVDADGQQNQLIDENEVTVTADKPQLDAHLKLPRPWPTGSYKVDVYLNGALDRTVTFSVK
jgi:hypothetical protein